MIPKTNYEEINSILCVVYIRVTYQTEPNQSLKLVGSIPQLGCWDPNKGLDLGTTPESYPVWIVIQGGLMLQKDTYFEFKIVVFEGGKFKEWEVLPGNANRSYTTRHWKTRLEISQNNIHHQELPLKKQVPFVETTIHENEKVRKKVKIKKMNPFEIARESDSESRSDNVSELFSGISDNASDLSATELSLSLCDKSDKRIYFLDEDADANMFDRTEEGRQQFWVKLFIDLKDRFLEGNRKSSIRNANSSYQQSASQLSSGNSLTPSQSQLDSQYTTSFFDEVTNYFQTVNKEDFIIFCSFYLPIKITVKNADCKVVKLEDIEKKYAFLNVDAKYFHMMKTITKENFKKFVWIGWSGIVCASEGESKLLEEYMLKHYSFLPLFFEREKVDTFTNDLCNSKLAGVFHNLVEEHSFDYEIMDDKLWVIYNEINKEFAQAAYAQYQKAQKSPNNEEVLFFIYDYHLMKTPGLLRRSILASNQSSQKKHKIGYYLNRYFPPPELFQRVLPPKSLIASLLFCDVINFPLYDFAKNFFTCVEKYFRIQLRTFKGGDLCLVFHGRVILIRISHPNIDPCLLDEISESKSFKQSFQEYSQHLAKERIFLGIDPLSKYSGLELKFHAFKMFVKDSGEYNLKLVQVIIIGRDSEFRNEAVLKTYQRTLEDLAAHLNTELNIFFNKADGHEQKFIEVVMQDSLDRESLYSLMKISVAFVKTSIKEPISAEYLEYICINPSAFLIMSLFSHFKKGLNTIQGVNPMNLRKLVKYLKRSLNLNLREQQVKTRLDKQTLRTHSISTWLTRFILDLKKFSFFDEREYEVAQEVDKYEGDVLYLLNTHTQKKISKLPTIKNCYNSSSNRVLLFGFEGVFFDEEKVRERFNGRSYHELDASIRTTHNHELINQNLLSRLKELLRDPLNNISIISSYTEDILEPIFGSFAGLQIFSENSAFVRKIGVDHKFISVAEMMYEEIDFGWIPIVREIMENYIRATEGSYVIEKRSAVAWLFEKVDSELAGVQARELVTQLKQVLSEVETVDIVLSDFSVEVKLKHRNKGSAACLSLMSAFMEHESVDFIISFGGSRETDDIINPTIRSFVQRKENQSMFSDDLRNIFSINIGKGFSHSDGNLRTPEDLERLFTQMLISQDNLSAKHSNEIIFTTTNNTLVY